MPGSPSCSTSRWPPHCGKLILLRNPWAAGRKAKGSRVGILLAAGVLLVTCILLVLVMQGKI